MNIDIQEQKDYIKRLHTGIQTLPTKGLLNKSEEDGLKELFPTYCDSYIAIEEIAKGAYKRTIHLMNPQTGKSLAFKTINLAALSERAKQLILNNGCKTSIELFEKESERMDRVCKSKNPHLTTPLGYGSLGNYYFFMEEYGERTLLDYIKKNHQEHALSNNSIKYLSLELADGLSVIHDEWLYHGDLHPDNILFRNAELRITDFDLTSSMFGIDDNKKYLVPHSETRSPELYAEQNLDLRADIWSYGIDVLFMKNGKMPFPKTFNGS